MTLVSHLTLLLPIWLLAQAQVLAGQAPPAGNRQAKPGRALDERPLPTSAVRVPVKPLAPDNWIVARNRNRQSFPGMLLSQFAADGPWSLICSGPTSCCGSRPTREISRG